MAFMEGFLDANDVVAEVVLLRAAENRCLLLVEGHSDKKALCRFISSSCDIVVCNGKEYALAATSELKELDYAGIVCVVDADHDPLLDQDVSNENVIVTDQPDLNVAIFRSAAFERTLLELGSQEKLNALQASGRDIFVMIRDLGFQIGRLRYLSRADPINLRFDDLKYRYVNRANFSAATLDMVSEVANHSRNHGVCRPTLTSRVDSIVANDDERWSYCCGHDLAHFLGKALQAIAGSRSVGASATDVIESYLRVGFCDLDFIQTNIYVGLQAWEARNVGYTCLREDLAA